MLPKWYTLAIALCIVMMLAVIANAKGKKVKLCELRGSPCVVVTLPGPKQCRDVFGYWICYGRPRK